MERNARISTKRKDKSCDSWASLTKVKRIMAGESGYTGRARLDERTLKARLKSLTFSEQGSVLIKTEF